MPETDAENTNYISFFPLRVFLCVSASLRQNSSRHIRGRSHRCSAARAIQRVLRKPRAAMRVSAHAPRKLKIAGIVHVVIHHLPKASRRFVAEVSAREV